MESPSHACGPERLDITPASIPVLTNGWCVEAICRTAPFGGGKSRGGRARWRHGRLWRRGDARSRQCAIVRGRCIYVVPAVFIRTRDLEGGADVDGAPLASAMEAIRSMRVRSTGSGVVAEYSAGAQLA